ncbi:hypothetical protein SB11R_09955 [Pseudomonas oryzihabitans]|nr:hypothetical protein SB11R_09955 [Pseudomonas psychrotolerans]
MTVAPLPPLLNQALDAAASHLHVHVQAQRHHKQKTGEALPTDFAGIMFSGNPHETVPRRLLLDDRLSPLERNAWQVFRLLMNGDGVTAFPTYEQLRPYLGSSPGKPASRETVAKALTVLRLTRWLSLGRRVRDSVTGRVQGNIYILHDEPVDLAEALQLDSDYLPLVAQGIEHANASVKELAAQVFDSLSVSETRQLPTRVDVFQHRFRMQGLGSEPQEKPRVPEFGIRTQGEQALENLSSDSELSETALVSGPSDQSSESELSGNQEVPALVRNPNSYSTYTYTDTSVCKSSVPRAPDKPQLTWPKAGQLLTEAQREHARSALNALAPEIRDPLLDQWGARCNAGGVKKPFGYLMKLVQRALKGEFNTDWQPGLMSSVQEPGRAAPVSLAPEQHPPIPFPRYQEAPTQRAAVSDAQTGRMALNNIKSLIGRGGSRQ